MKPEEEKRSEPDTSEVTPAIVEKEERGEPEQEVVPEQEIEPIEIDHKVYDFTKQQIRILEAFISAKAFSAESAIPGAKLPAINL
ncbi:MAG: hypothetical protein IIB38_11720 [Candidatus Hydrogenedentes bacterium]|nr:hypothetical protein [Candidatus Hydrogenedentota bacterium]